MYQLPLWLRYLRDLLAEIVALLVLLRQLIYELGRIVFEIKRLIGIPLVKSIKWLLTHLPF